MLKLFHPQTIYKLCEKLDKLLLDEHLCICTLPPLHCSLGGGGRAQLHVSYCYECPTKRWRNAKKKLSVIWLAILLLDWKVKMLCNCLQMRAGMIVKQITRAHIFLLFVLPRLQGFQTGIFQANIWQFQSLSIIVGRVKQDGDSRKEGCSVSFHWHFALVFVVFFHGVFFRI